MNKHRLLPILMIGAAIWAVAGCATMSGIETPHIQLAGIRLQEMKGFESVFLIDLRVINPNNVALPIRGVDLDLSLEGRNIAKGVANLQKEIAAYSSEIVPVTVYASMLGMLDIAQRIVRGLQQENFAETWNYAINGHMLPARGSVQKIAPCFVWLAQPTSRPLCALAQDLALVSCASSVYPINFDGALC